MTSERDNLQEQLDEYKEENKNLKDVIEALENKIKQLTAIPHIFN